MVQTGLLELVGRGDSDWAGDSATRQSVTGYHCDAQNVPMCNRSLKQTALSLSSCEAEFYAASACAGELLGLAELFKELHYKISVRLEMDSDSARHILQRRGAGGLKHIEIRYLSIQQWIREKRLSVSRVDTKNNTADLFTKHLDGPRTQSLSLLQLVHRQTSGSKQAMSQSCFQKQVQSYCHLVLLQITDLAAAVPFSSKLIPNHFSAFFFDRNVCCIQSDGHGDDSPAG